jgi:transposase-like protein
MKKTRYSEEQIIGVLKQMEAGRKVADLARELGVSEATLYNSIRCFRQLSPMRRLANSALSWGATIQPTT